MTSTHIKFLHEMDVWKMQTLVGQCKQDSDEFKAYLAKPLERTHAHVGSVPSGMGTSRKQKVAKQVQHPALRLLLRCQQRQLETQSGPPHPRADAAGDAAKAAPGGCARR